jgi:demethylmenaquinone methyltransferase/2-methoxy-6-polyprenyl-1,4-benzoquinol methylase
MSETIVPYKENTGTKKEQVREMFNNISPKYDLLNLLLSGGIDRYWRKRAIGKLKKVAPKLILDVATGTGDLAIAAMKLNPEKVIGVDLSEQMVAIGREKVAKKGLASKIDLQTGDSENLPFQDNYFDAVIVSFGVRNFENLEKGLSDINRVLHAGGTLVVLEFSKPKGWLISRIYQFYFKYILPLIGRMISKDQSAYTYLPQSVNAFPEGEKFVQILKNVGFTGADCERLSFGICSVYTAKKAG